MGTWAAAQFTANDDERLKAVGIVTMNRDENVTVHVYKNSAFPPASDSIALLTQSFNIQEKGYDMLDLKRSLLFAKGEQLILAVEFKYAEGHEHPIVFVTDGKVDMPPTYWTSSSAWNWSAFPENSAFYLQAIMSDESTVCDPLRPSFLNCVKESAVRGLGMILGSDLFLDFNKATQSALGTGGR